MQADSLSEVRPHLPLLVLLKQHSLPLIALATAFTRSLSTLLRLSSPGSTSGDIDFTCTPSRLSLSVVNPSRTAFGVAHFYQPFFAHYRVQGTDKAKAFKFAVTGKVGLSSLFFSATRSVCE